MIDIANFFLDKIWLVALWTIPWKGVALWKAAKQRQTVWFIAILLLNTLAILEILYIFVFSKGGLKTKNGKPALISEKITFDDFQKVKIQIGTVTEAEKVVDSEKLLKLKVDLGTEKRQVIAGIAKAYKPDDLIKKQIVLVTNLEPRIIMGLESRAMLLVTGKERPVLIVPEKNVASGIEIS